MSYRKPFQILLADDDDDDTFLFGEALGQLPTQSELLIASNGMELMHLLQTDKVTPDIIFLDMNMPVKNGLECLTEIRATPGFEQVPIIILSTSIARYLWESALKGGANLYIQKPTSFAGLVEVLQKCLSERVNLVATPDVEQFLITN